MDKMQLATLISSLLTAFIGTFVGAFVVIKRQEARSRYPRKLMLEVLKQLKKYDSYQKAESEFNNRSVVEKKAVLIALRNLGIPLRIDVINDSYDVSNVHFDDLSVNKESIDKMIDFVKKGLCDDLFFKEIGESLYNASPKIVFARSLALRFLDALTTQPGTASVEHVFSSAGMNFNQFQVIQVFYSTVDFIESGSVSQEKIEFAKKNVKNGVFDNLFYWDYRAFSNMNSQRNAADAVVSAMVQSKSM